MPWSYSSLTSYETCPRRHHETKVLKRVKEPEGLPLILGNAAHKVLELRAKTGAPIPKVVQATTATGETGTMSTEGWEEMMAKILAREGEVITERQIALDDRLCETDWFAKDVWVRGVIDFGLLNGRKALLIDWKTGKRSPANDQLMLFSALAMHVWPKLDRVLTGFRWLKENKTDSEEFTRADISRIWDHFVPRVRRLEHAHETDTWEAKPSGLCGWCSVSTCEFWKERRR